MESVYHSTWARVVNILRVVLTPISLLGSNFIRVKNSFSIPLNTWQGFKQIIQSGNSFYMPSKIILNVCYFSVSGWWEQQRAKLGIDVQKQGGGSAMRSERGLALREQLRGHPVRDRLCPPYGGRASRKHHIWEEKHDRETVVWINTFQLTNHFISRG